MAAVRVVGVDLASQPKRTSVCVAEWADRAAAPRVVDLVSGADDNDIVGIVGIVEIVEDEEIAEGGLDDGVAGVNGVADRVAGVGIDCPFGWPAPFVDLVTRHHAGAAIADHPATARQLRLRATDLHIREIVGRDPLSVSTDLLGVVALRGVRILERLVGPGADRSGRAGVYEVYPGGALAVWGLPSRGYKGRGPRAQGAAAVRRTIVDALGEHVDLAGTEDRLVTSDDDLDAVLAALVTGLAVAGRTTGPPPERAELAELAAVEGWIHVPAGPLEDLARARSGSHDPAAHDPAAHNH